VSSALAVVAGGLSGLHIARLLRDRLWLSLAKHRSLTGHPRIALRLSRLLPGYQLDEDVAFGVDGAPPDVVRRRREGFRALAERQAERTPRTRAEADRLRQTVSDAAFVDANRVPFPFRDLVRERFPGGVVLDRSEGGRVRDLDGNWSYDLTGAYGVNLFGAEFYRGCIERANEVARDLSLSLGPYHPIVADNAERLCQLSGMDEVSFHMSGTEAVMQAVRMARFHTRRRYAVRFCGAYHGWSDGLQAGPGNPLPARDLLTLEEMSERTLRVLRTRRDIACVLVNPLQALSPNAPPPSDATLVTNVRRASFDREAYARWLGALREVCSARGIALVMDEVFLGFRLARGGAQEYFGVRADLVTYGKTLGGGLPVGVVCGKARWMKRFRDDAPADLVFARGTFNAHPYVMAAMNEFLRALDSDEIRATYSDLDARWAARARRLNSALEAEELPVSIAGLVSVWTTLYSRPGRFHWMLQFYLRDAGLLPSWIGSGRYIFSHSLSDEDFEEITARFVKAARAMEEDGWWWSSPELTGAAVQRSLRREILAAFFGRRSESRPTPLDGRQADAV
jgi:glutamate-1-semialdehyde 2,1-aminomutase